MTRISNPATVFLFVLLGFASGAPAAGKEKKNKQSLHEVIERLKPENLLRTDFAQTKHVSALSKPLLSQGKLIFSRSHGVLWQIRKPFPLTYALTKQNVVQFEEGKKPVIVAVAQQPVVHEFIELFLSLFSGDVSVLENRFEINYIAGKTDWQLGLVPKNSTIRQYITSLQISGNQFIREIVIREKGGDFTKIILSNSSYDNRLTTHEQRLFTQS